MTNSGDYVCIAASASFSGEAVAGVRDEALELTVSGAPRTIDFSDILSFTAESFRVTLDTTSGKVELSRLGRGFEGFSDDLKRAFEKRVREALFVENLPFMECAGEYEYGDEGGAARGEARLCLYPDCLCILPSDIGARRVPLCFISDLTREGYLMRARLDTGESYSFMRLGRDMVPFYENALKFARQSQEQWASSLSALGENILDRLGEARGRFELLQKLCGLENVGFGLFSPSPDPNQPFWLCAVSGSRAAVELITTEKTATYLYAIPGSAAEFVSRLRRAVEAVGTRREVIFLDEASINANTLYKMTVARSSHVRFLRSCAAGRVIHTDAWEQKISAFLRG